MLDRRKPQERTRRFWLHSESQVMDVAVQHRKNGVLPVRFSR
jgi:hypothetical protein